MKTKIVLTLRPALISMALAAALTGCGVAGIGGDTPKASSTSTTAPEDLALKFARCMRQHGVDMDDPKPGGGISVNVNKGDEAKVEAAHKACKEFDPIGENGPEMSAEDYDQAVKMAECLRRNGVDAEIPKPGQPSRIKSRKGQEGNLDKAMKICQKEVPPPARKSADSGLDSEE